jgi:acetoin utilization deacetylase AcuC-like enzyme
VTRQSPVRVIWHPSSLDHNPGAGHPESPERVRAVLAALRDPAMASIVAFEEAVLADPADLLRAHDARYLEQLAQVAARGGGRLDEDTVMSDASLAAATFGAGAAVRAASLALDGTPAFAAVRPPGHHALRDRAMGFCLVNNVVVAALAVIHHRALDRVLIVDWDVHHGNGTQAMVERDPRIRYVSLHQWPLYPGTGRAEETGVGNIFNVPRPPGLPADSYQRDLDEAVAKATSGWAPQLILISAGFDALAGDPLAQFTLEPEHYVAWVRRWREIGAPIASVLEGGYAPPRVAQAAAAHVRALA